MGRHARPKNKKKLTDKVALGATMTLGAAVVPATFASPAHAAPDEAWERIAACESGDMNTFGSARWNLPYGHASSTGGLQIQLPTWNDYGGQEYAPAAYQATKAQQIAVAERILAGQGPGAWVCNNPGHGIASGALNGHPGDANATPNTPPATPPAGDNQRGASNKAAKEVLKLVNAERAAEGLPALVADGKLDKYAYEWARTMAHAGRMYHSNLGFAGNPRGENVAFGQDSPAEVVQGWMDSPGHRKNILSEDFTKMGLGLHDDGTPYWAQVFAGGDRGKPAPKPEPSGEPADAEDGVYVVKKGDWLAKIARKLGIAGGWPRLYEINREAVGSNPHLIYPGLKLRLPGHEAPTTPVEPPAPPVEEEPPPPKPDPAPSASVTLPLAGTVGDGLIVGGGGSLSRTAGGHSGLDISAPHGTPVRSAAAGKVVDVNGGAGAAYGNYVTVEHSGGIYTLYAHLSAVTVSVGQTVGAGQQIGNVGSSGSSSGPHLHFEVRNDPTQFNAGIFLDPVAWLRSNGVTV